MNEWLKVLFYVLFFIAMFFLGTFLFMVFWNWAVIPAVTSAVKLGFWGAMKLFVFIALYIGGSRVSNK